MSRPSIAAPQRNLNLTEELEKLEQSITLTLQEIDHNFSRAHRIVTTSILPIVDQYAQHSSAVWEGSKFWKQFFEASANVSLSSYEEPPENGEEPTATETEAEDEQDPSTQFTPSSSSYASPSQPSEPIATPEARTYRPPPPEEEDEESTFSTPRPSKPPPQPTFSSPYESLKRNINAPYPDEPPSASTLPSTPRAQADSSPFAPPPSTARAAAVARTPANDILLHRVLDKNWRLQATPHAQPKLPGRGQAFGSARKAQRKEEVQEDEMDDSSPFVPVPELHAEIFDSPVRRMRVPGVSLLTPGKGKGKGAGTGGDVGKQKGGGGLWDSDSDDEGLEEGMSPPKTMQFHVPRERLLKTPAKEASKRIVEDLLLTAGGNVTDDLDEDSPSVVRRTQAMDEDTF